MTLYAVWQKQNTNAPTITVATVNGSAGKEVTVGISIENNPGIASMDFAIVYDKTKLKLVGYEDSQFTGWTVGVDAGEKASWYSNDNKSVNGEIVKLKFNVLNEAKEGEAYISLNDIVVYCVDGNEEKEVNANLVQGGINITNRIPGDANDGGKVNGADLVRISRYLAGYDVKINLSNADATGDGKVNGADLVRISRYLAGYPVKLY